MPQTYVPTGVFSRRLVISTKGLRPYLHLLPLGIESAFAHAVAQGWLRHSTGDVTALYMMVGPEAIEEPPVAGGGGA